MPVSYPTDVGVAAISRHMRLLLGSALLVVALLVACGGKTNDPPNVFSDEPVPSPPAPECFCGPPPAGDATPALPSDAGSDPDASDGSDEPDASAASDASLDGD
jgi:hypothetical protein